jgi:hypothetical protein
VRTMIHGQIAFEHDRQENNECVFDLPKYENMWQEAKTFTFASKAPWSPNLTQRLEKARQIALILSELDGSKEARERGK